MGWRAIGLAFCGAAAVLFVAPAFAADDGIETIVVTASKRAENVQKVPFSVTALSQKDLTARGATSVEQAIGYVPGVNFSSNGTNAGAYSIRGVNTSSYVANTQSPVALYIDDINILDPVYPKVTTNLNLFDVSRVEVLEGPQGTLFGSGSLGGAVRVITNKPDASAFSAEAQATVSSVAGGDVGYGFNGMANIPLVDDTLALRVVGTYRHYAGWVDNISTGQKNVNHALSAGGRVELGWQPTADLNIVATALFENDRPHDSPYSFYANGQYKWDGVVQNTNDNRTNIYSLNGTYDLHWASLTSITTYADRKEAVLADFTRDALFLLGTAYPSSVTDNGPSRTISQEVRLASPDDARVKWLIGGIYIDNRRTVDETVTVAGSHLIFGGTSDAASITDSKVGVREEAVFGEVSYEIVPQFTATAGARVFYNTLNVHQVIAGSAEKSSTVTHNADENAVTPKFNISWRAGPGSIAYVQAAEGYRIGLVNTAAPDLYSSQPIPVASNPDRLWNYELGTKNILLDDRLIANLALYHIDWSDIQLDQLTVPSGINFIANAGNAHINGAELALEYRPVIEWTFGGSVSLLQSRLDQVNPTVVAHKGDKLPGSAPVNLVGYIEHTQPIGDDAAVFARVDAKYSGKEYAALKYTGNNAALRDSTSLTYGEYASVNLRAGLDWANYTLTGFVENLADSGGKVSAFYALKTPVAIRQKPRTFGLTLDAKF
jgi:outer membrane receptor protein involved in Fe transport